MSADDGLEKARCTFVTNVTTCSGSRYFNPHLRARPLPSPIPLLKKCFNRYSKELLIIVLGTWTRRRHGEHKPRTCCSPRSIYFTLCWIDTRRKLKPDRRHTRRAHDPRTHNDTRTHSLLGTPLAPRRGCRRAACSSRTWKSRYRGTTWRCGRTSRSAGWPSSRCSGS